MKKSAGKIKGNEKANMKVMSVSSFIEKEGVERASAAKEGQRLGLIMCTARKREGASRIARASFKAMKKKTVKTLSRQGSNSQHKLKAPALIKKKVGSCLLWGGGGGGRGVWRERKKGSTWAHPTFSTDCLYSLSDQKARAWKSCRLKLAKATLPIIG